MKTAKEFWLSKHPDAEKDWQKTGHDDNFQVRMMEEYAKYYHKQQVNSVDLANVVGQSEQLPCDCSKYPTYFDNDSKPRCKNCNERSWLAR